MSKALIDLIPPAELNEKLSHPYCELEPDFLCFEQYYWPVAEHVPTDYEIYDVGCYMAAQSYMFLNHREYYGIDCYDMYDSDTYIAPPRFKPENAMHFKMTGQQFIHDILPRIDQDKAYFVASAVPDFVMTKLLFSVTKNCLVAYPGRIPMSKGISHYEIVAEIRKSEWRD